MTRKDYEELAQIVRAAKARYGELQARPHPLVVVGFFETELADYCARDNARFDYGRFEKACEVEK